jgi:hypothetical protein
VKCIACGNEIKDELKAILMSSDGDFVCDEKCKKKWEDEIEEFHKTIGNDPERFERWLLGEE